MCESEEQSEGRPHGVIGDVGWSSKTRKRGYSCHWA